MFTGSVLAQDAATITVNMTVTGPCDWDGAPFLSNLTVHDGDVCEINNPPTGPALSVIIESNSVASLGGGTLLVGNASDASATVFEVSGNVTNGGTIEIGDAAETDDATLDIGGLLNLSGDATVDGTLTTISAAGATNTVIINNLFIQAYGALNLYDDSALNTAKDFDILGTLDINAGTLTVGNPDNVTPRVYSTGSIYNSGTLTVGSTGVVGWPGDDYTVVNLDIGSYIENESGGTMTFDDDVGCDSNYLYMYGDIVNDGTMNIRYCQNNLRGTFDNNNILNIGFVPVVDIHRGFRIEGGALTNSGTITADILYATGVGTLDNEVGGTITASTAPANFGISLSDDSVGTNMGTINAYYLNTYNNGSFINGDASTHTPVVNATGVVLQNSSTITNHAEINSTNVNTNFSSIFNNENGGVVDATGGVIVDAQRLSGTCVPGDSPKFYNKSGASVTALYSRILGPRSFVWAGPYPGDCPAELYNNSGASYTLTGANPSGNQAGLEILGGYVENANGATLFQIDEDVLITEDLQTPPIPGEFINLGNASIGTDLDIQIGGTMTNSTGGDLDVTNAMTVYQGDFTNAAGATDMDVGGELNVGGTTGDHGTFTNLVDGGTITTGSIVVDGYGDLDNTGDASNDANINSLGSVTVNANGVYTGNQYSDNDFDTTVILDGTMNIDGKMDIDSTGGINGDLLINATGVLNTTANADADLYEFMVYGDWTNAGDVTVNEFNFSDPLRVIDGGKITNNSVYPKIFDINGPMYITGNTSLVDTIFENNGIVTASQTNVTTHGYLNLNDGIWIEGQVFLVGPTPAYPGRLNIGANGTLSAGVDLGSNSTKYGILVNNGTIRPLNPDGTNALQSLSIIVRSQSTFTNNGTMDMQGSLMTYVGDITLQDSGAFTNSATGIVDRFQRISLREDSTFDNFGTITNNRYLQIPDTGGLGWNGGTFTEKTGSSHDIYDLITVGGDTGYTDGTYNIDSGATVDMIYTTMFPDVYVQNDGVINANDDLDIPHKLNVVGGGNVYFNAPTNTYDVGYLKIKSPTSGTDISTVELTDSTSTLSVGEWTIWHADHCGGASDQCSIDVGRETGTGKSQLNIDGTLAVPVNSNNSFIKVGTAGNGEINISDTGTFDVDEDGAPIVVYDKGWLKINGTADFETSLTIEGDMIVDDNDSYISTVDFKTPYTISSTGKVDQGLTSTVTVEGSVTSVYGDYELNGTLNAGDLTVYNGGKMHSGVGTTTAFLINADSVDIDPGGAISSNSVSIVDRVDADDGGGSYGGQGYDSNSTPTATTGATKVSSLTSGYGERGESSTNINGAGGGGVNLNVIGNIINDGAISADGQANYNLTYGTQTSPFTVGKILTGASSTATGVIIANSGTALTLNITSLPITFSSGEIITDDNVTPGSATTTGVPSLNPAAGAGGTIIITHSPTATGAYFSGIGSITADGGDGTYPGGGGRIVIDSPLLDDPDFGSYDFGKATAGTVSAYGGNDGSTEYAAAGTIVYAGDEQKNTKTCNTTEPCDTLIIDQGGNVPDNSSITDLADASSVDWDRIEINNNAIADLTNASPQVCYKLNSSTEFSSSICSSTTALPDKPDTLYLGADLGGSTSGGEPGYIAGAKPTGVDNTVYSVADLTPQISAIYRDPTNAKTASQMQIQVDDASAAFGSIIWDYTTTTIDDQGGNGTLDPDERSEDIEYDADGLASYDLDPAHPNPYYIRTRFIDSDGAGLWSHGDYNDHYKFEVEEADCVWYLGGLTVRDDEVCEINEDTVATYITIEKDATTVNGVGGTLKIGKTDDLIAGSVTLTVNGPVTNGGDIEIGDPNTTGAWDTILDINGDDLTIEGNGTKTAEVLTYANSTTNMDNVLDVDGVIYAGTSTASQGTLTLGDDSTTSTATSVEVYGTFDNDDGTFTTPTMNVGDASNNGGTVGNDGTMALTNLSVYRNGNYNNNAGGITTVSASTDIYENAFFDGTVTNNGTFTTTDLDIGYNLSSNGGLLVNNVGDTFTVSDEFYVGNTSYNGQIDNYGDLNANGAFTVASEIQSGFLFKLGTINNYSTGTLNTPNGTFNIGYHNPSINGGTFNNDGGTFNASYNDAGNIASIELWGGTFDNKNSGLIDSAYTFYLFENEDATPAQGLDVDSSSTFNSYSLSIGDPSHEGGILDNDGNVNIESLEYNCVFMSDNATIYNYGTIDTYVGTGSCAFIAGGDNLIIQNGDALGSTPGTITTERLRTGDSTGPITITNNLNSTTTVTIDTQIFDGASLTNYGTYSTGNMDVTGSFTAPNDDVANSTTVTNGLYVYGTGTASLLDGVDTYNIGNIEIQSDTSGTSSITVDDEATVTLTNTHTGCTNTTCTLEIGTDAGAGSSSMTVDGTLTLTNSSPDSYVEIGGSSTGSLTIEDDSIFTSPDTDITAMFVYDGGTFTVEGTADLEHPLDVYGDFIVDTTDATNALVTLKDNLWIRGTTGIADQGLSSTVTVENSATHVYGDYQLDGTLNSGDLTVYNNGLIHSGGDDELQTTSNFYINADNLDVQTGGAISSDGVSMSTNPLTSGGGSYGGEGVAAVPAATYGATKATTPIYGMTGELNNNRTGKGGGGVEIYADGNITINGTVSANGEAGYGIPYGSRTSPFNIGAIVYDTSGNSAHITGDFDLGGGTGSLAISPISGTLQSGDVLTDDGVVPGSATATSAPSYFYYAGSGGTVIIRQDVDPITDVDAFFIGSGTISADGGGSPGGTSPGGGGRIVIDSPLIDDPDFGSYDMGEDGGSVHAYGGNNGGAIHAAAGTVVYLGDRNNTDGTLIVDQNGTNPSGTNQTDLASADAAVHFDTQTANFTIGQTLTGGTSGATGTITAIDDYGTMGTVIFTPVSGRFQNNETITDGLGGSATSDSGSLDDTFDRVEVDDNADADLTGATTQVCYNLNGSTVAGITCNASTSHPDKPDSLHIEATWTGTTEIGAPEEEPGYRATPDGVSDTVYEVGDIGPVFAMYFRNPGDPLNEHERVDIQVADNAAFSDTGGAGNTILWNATGKDGIDLGVGNGVIDGDWTRDIEYDENGIAISGLTKGTTYYVRARFKDTSLSAPGLWTHGDYNSQYKFTPTSYGIITVENCNGDGAGDNSLVLSRDGYSAGPILSPISPDRHGYGTCDVHVSTSDTVWSIDYSMSTGETDFDNGSGSSFPQTTDCDIVTDGTGADAESGYQIITTTTNTDNTLLDTNIEDDTECSAICTTDNAYNATDCYFDWELEASEDTLFDTATAGHSTGSLNDGIFQIEGHANANWSLSSGSYNLDTTFTLNTTP
ncbi:beta strand repeat-containing protein [Patescibacteria group bacterium]